MPTKYLAERMDEWRKKLMNFTVMCKCRWWTGKVHPSLELGKHSQRKSSISHCTNFLLVCIAMQVEFFWCSRWNQFRKTEATFGFQTENLTENIYTSESTGFGVKPKKKMMKQSRNLEHKKLPSSVGWKDKARKLYYYWIPEASAM